MGTEQRYDIYDLFLRYPDPLAPRRRRLEVPERMDRDGNTIVALDRDAVRDAARRLAADGVEAIAICFLHAYRDPAHEREAGEIVRALLPDVAVSWSSDVVAELWQYQRLVTTCANAFEQPLMDRYVQRLERELWQRGFRGALTLMHSEGGLVLPETARAYPIRLLASGPAGGGLATAFFGKLAGHDDMASFDMGGTTAKACLIENGRAAIVAEMEAARVHRFKNGSGPPIKAPVIDMIEIDAGGGSIASIDEVRLLRVGPRSAGADPGPACYGRGGTDATVTDAKLVLGYYDPGFFLGGRMALDRGAAERALTAVSAKVELSAIETAWGIHRVVTESMAAAARIHIVEKARDPRAYAMVGFGGAGPAHVARILGVREVLIPPAPGAASALGFHELTLIRGAFPNVSPGIFHVSKSAAAKPLFEIPAQRTWTFEFNITACQSNSVCQIAQPYFGQGSEVGRDMEIDLEPRIDWTNVHLGRRADQPPLTATRRDSGEVELNRGASGREEFRMNLAVDVPHQQAHIEFVVTKIGAIPSLAPLAQHVDDRRELPALLSEMIFRGLAAARPCHHADVFKLLEPKAQHRS